MLFDQVAEDLAKTRAAANDEILLWPEKLMPGNKRLDFHEKARLNAHLIGADHAVNTLPYKRLKTAMDAWCALWLWPLDKVDLLPTRAEFLQGMAMILEGGFTADGALAAPSVAEFADPAPDFLELLEPDAPARELFKPAIEPKDSLFRETNVEALIETFDWLRTAVEVAERARFVHFDLVFADVMKAQGGFDVIVGNPPWAKPSWNEGQVLGDVDPGLIVKNLSASEVMKARDDILRDSKVRSIFLSAFAAEKGSMHFTGSEVCNPYAGSGQNNLYRCFIDLSFRIGASSGIVAFIHQDGHLTEPASGPFREECYTRLKKRFHFRNQLSQKMFSEIGHRVEFSLNIYGLISNEIEFDNLTQMFLPSQVDECYSHDGSGSIPAIKNELGKWDTRGHIRRIVKITDESLSKIKEIFDDASTPTRRSKFMSPFSSDRLSAFGAISSANSWEKGFSSYQISPMWHESTAQKELHAIVRSVGFPERERDVILSAPNIYVNNPIYQSVGRYARSHGDYLPIDLTIFPESAHCRTVFKPDSNLKNYDSALPKSAIHAGSLHSDFVRLAFRRRIGPHGERTLISAIVPPHWAHVHALLTVSFSDQLELLQAASIASSIPIDFLIKSSGRGDIITTTVHSLPYVVLDSTALSRTLRLNALSSSFSNFWNELHPKMNALPWSSPDPRLQLEGPVNGPANWDRTAGLRTEFARRMALVENDVLVAQALGLTLESDS